MKWVCVQCIVEPVKQQNCSGHPPQVWGIDSRLDFYIISHKYFSFVNFSTPSIGLQKRLWLIPRAHARNKLWSGFLIFVQNLFNNCSSSKTLEEENQNSKCFLTPMTISRISSVISRPKWTPTEQCSACAILNPGSTHTTFLTTITQPLYHITITTITKVNFTARQTLWVGARLQRRHRYRHFAGPEMATAIRAVSMVVKQHTITATDCSISSTNKIKPERQNMTHTQD